MSNFEQSIVFFDLGDTLIYGQDQRYNDALDTLQILHERGYRLGLISNHSKGTTIDQVYAFAQSRF